MLIKKKPPRWLTFFKKIRVKPRFKFYKFGFVFLILTLILFLITGPKIWQKWGRGYTDNVKIFASKMYYRTFTQAPEILQLDISFKNLQKIEQKRQEAIDRNLLISSDDDYVGANLSFNGQETPVDVRLKGDLADHFAGDKWSFRIKVDGDNSFRGMSRFSIQDPKTRNYLHDWLYYQAVKELGLIAIRYDYVDVAINGENKGLFAVEEYFTKEMLEHNKRREAPIIKLSEDYLWSNKARYGEDTYQDSGLMYSAVIEPFQSGKTSKEPLRSQFLNAKALLHQYRQGQVSAAEVFNVEEWGKVFALSDIFGVRHGFAFGNIRLYYNPLTTKFDPIPYDPDAGSRINYLAIDADTRDFQFFKLLDDPQITEEYIDTLSEMCNQDFIGTLLQDNQAQLDEFLNYINREERYVFTGDSLVYNQSFVCKKLTQDPGLRVISEDQDTLRVVPLLELPMEIIGVFTETGESLTGISQEEPYGVPKFARQVVEPIILELYRPVTASELKTITVEYRVLGTDNAIATGVEEWPLNQQFRAQPTQASVPDWVVETQEGYLINSGSYDLESVMVVPENSLLVIEPGVEINQINEGGIVSHSPIVATGTTENGIMITSADGTGRGLLVLKADDRSLLEYVTFSNLSAHISQVTGITGSVTFFDSPVTFKNVVMDTNSAEDFLNIVSSPFELDQVSITKAFSDAIDIDFSDGSMKNIRVLKPGNDGLDFSTSKVQLNGIHVEEASDKCLSVGEGSDISIDTVNLKGCNIGAAVKDLSSLQLTFATIEDSNYGVVAYQKKPEYGPATAEIWGSFIRNTNQRFMIENDSYIYENGIVNRGSTANLFQELYPEE